MKTDTFNDDQERRTCRKLLTIISKFREQDAEMPIQQAVTFLWVALNEGKTQRDARQSLDMPASSASRNLAALSKVHRLGKEGLGLIQFDEDPNDRRAKILSLTPKGRAFLSNIMGDLR